ncbi:GDSL/SGNH-like acyl-esterase family found in Pmr5 and Cas1p-domain-containing protein [Geranomyces variabilis]|nr:GDSL/SGNH-like acyl-esterase family found in Pmr5 and Cas1p-domain-containing protein [Geranomyces variabilis]KAJ3135894.1 hypothetical protein HDU90_003635 [Geranomyces variabilis]
MAPEYARLPTASSTSSISTTTSSKKPSTFCIIFPLLALTALVSSVLTAYSPLLVAHLVEQQSQSSSATPPSSAASSASSASSVSPAAAAGWKRITSKANWRNSAAYRTRYASCPLLDTQDKCEQARYDRLLAWEWTNDNKERADLTPLPTGRRARDVALKCLAGKTLGLSGDSLSRQSFHSLACLLHADGATLSISKSGSLDVVQATFENTSSLPVTLLWTGDSLNPYLLAYTGNRPEPTINYTALHPTLTELLTHSPDYLVLNTGLWVDASSFRSRVLDFYQAYTKIIRSALALLLPPKKLDNDEPTTQTQTQKTTRIVFRTSPMRHFQNGDYSSDGSCPDLVPRFNASATTYYGGFAETLQNAKLKEILSDARGPGGVVAVLDAAEIAFARADAHRSEKDCSHYCLPGVPDFWNEVLLQSIWETCEEESDE